MRLYNLFQLKTYLWMRGLGPDVVSKGLNCWISFAWVNWVFSSLNC